MTDILTPSVKLRAIGITLLRKLRADGAREYSTHEEVRRHYRDGFTDGWDAREATIGELKRLLTHANEGHLCAGYRGVDPECPDCNSIAGFGKQLEERK